MLKNNFDLLTISIFHSNMKLNYLIIFVYLIFDNIIFNNIYNVPKSLKLKNILHKYSNLKTLLFIMV
jgi:hypothetical protein